MSNYKECYNPKDSQKNQFGDAYYKTVIETDQLSCGELVVPAHSKAGHDGGHEGADEIFYIVRGTATVIFPNTDERTNVPAGCYIMMPRSTPHEVANNADDELQLIFSCVKR